VLPRSPMHWAEGGSRHGDEHTRVRADRGRYTLVTADQARANQVEGVGTVDLRAGGTPGDTTVATAHQQFVSRFGCGAVCREQFTGSKVDPRGLSGQTDGAGTTLQSTDSVDPPIQVVLVQGSDVCQCGTEQTTEMFGFGHDET